MQKLNLTDLQFGIDGDQYYYLYGENLQEGYSGFGSTINDAARDFVFNSPYTIPEIGIRCFVMYDGDVCYANITSLEGETYTATIEGSGVVISNLTEYNPC